MKKQLSLNGQWWLKYSEYASGERFNFHTDVNKTDWLPAQVPGDVHLDLMKAGIIKDPFYGIESDHCIWIEEKDWWYRTTFSFAQLSDLKDRKRVYLLFHGLDTFASVYLNGEKIGCHSNMFTPLQVDITKKVKAGENDLRVCLASPAFSPNIHRDSNISRTPPQRLCTRKAQACYGWDIAPRLVTIGIWRPVELIVCDEIEILDSWISTKNIKGKKVEVELELDIGYVGNDSREIEIEIELYNQKRNVELNIDSVTTKRKEVFFLEDPPLWWPHNHGKPNLLPYSISIKENEKIIDHVESRFGVRTVELVQDTKQNGGKSFYFKINDKPIFLKGMNWTPSDAIYARITDERIEKLIDTVLKSNINSLRVWGGGFYESHKFYNLCDEKGILVWQDFMFACGVYPQDDVFISDVADEAIFIIKNLRNHPSIIIWCGDNENDWVYLQENIPDFWNNKINREVLQNISLRLDPSRPYISSSPFSFGKNFPNGQEEGNVHLWKHGSSYKDDFYAKSFPNMVTEIGHISLPDLEVMKSFIPEDKLWPPFNEYWYMHCSDPIRTGDSYRVQSYFDSIKANGLPEPQNLEELIKLTQQLQTEATEFWITHFSSLPDCWGIFLWNLCDCWPQISDAYIAYPYNEKPALEAVRIGFKKIDR
jgi:beta-mannosidase